MKRARVYTNASQVYALTDISKILIWRRFGLIEDQLRDPVIDHVRATLRPERRTLGLRGKHR